MPQPDHKYPETLEDMIAALHYHVADGNAPPELPEILEVLLSRIKTLENVINDIRIDDETEFYADLNRGYDMDRG